MYNSAVNISTRCCMYVTLCDVHNAKCCIVMICIGFYYLNKKSVLINKHHRILPTFNYNLLLYSPRINSGLQQISMD
jgi:hypothetical protein